eukprot:CAMPEP_0176444716 /NCGR_PEP_ID=MMETSP0127-20121128/23237_1 /TAXON_ID=938130 /ORGANISM="Platyophrya macrostoma, Strain WH" /LENGTH=452 /DNA_ID=CAMNT_0017830295 /DNA_START=17 /DNA_END=1375 /DNA_ORIENTATION=-
MDKTDKLNYQREVEKYLQSKHVYELFEDLMKSLILQKPADPINFMIHKLTDPPQKKIFIVGPPGSKARELSLQLADYLHYTCTSVGDLLHKEISKRSDLGKKIEDAYKQLTYVPDDIVTELVKKHIENLEKENKSFILEGFPKTRVQGLALQRAGIIPDSFIILNLPDQDIVDCINRKVQNSEGKLSHLGSDKSADYALEYNLNIKHVKEIYKNYYFQVDAAEEELLEEMARLVKYRIKSKAPKRSASILILGPPGAGRSSLAKLISQKYGLVHVNSSQLLKDQIARKTEIGKLSLSMINKGELVPDDVVASLVTTRIQQPDCRVHGYILDGFPKTKHQLLLLEELKIQPALIIILEANDDLVYKRLANRRIDPVSGSIYDEEAARYLDPLITTRLFPVPNEKPEILQKRLSRWKDLLKNVEQDFSSLILKVTADMSENNVLERVAYYLENT